MGWFLEVGVLLEAMEVLLFAGRYLAELVPKEAESALGLD